MNHVEPFQAEGGPVVSEIQKTKKEQSEIKARIALWSKIKKKLASNQS